MMIPLQWPGTLRRLRTALAPALTAAFFALASPAHAAGNVVISQIYGGGGNTGATIKNDFVELYNRSASAVDLTGWSLQYSSATGDSWEFSLQPLGGSIGAGEYYLVAVDKAQIDSWVESRFLTAAAPFAVRLSVRWGDTRTQDLTVAKVVVK